MVKRFIISLVLIILLLPLTLAAHPPVRYRDMPLGKNVQTTAKQLKKQGFKIVKTQDKEDDLFYGTYWEVFLLGEQDGYKRRSRRTRFTLVPRVRYGLSESEGHSGRKVYIDRTSLCSLLSWLRYACLRSKNVILFFSWEMFLD